MSEKRQDGWAQAVLDGEGLKEEGNPALVLERWEEYNKAEEKKNSRVL